MSDDPVDTLFAKAVRFGVPMSEACDRAGIARSTPSRWKRDPNSATFGKVRRLSTAIDEIVEGRGGAVHAATVTAEAAAGSSGNAGKISAPAGAA